MQENFYVLLTVSQSQDYLERTIEGNSVTMPMTIYTFDITDPVTDFLETTV